MRSLQIGLIVYVIVGLMLNTLTHRNGSTASSEAIHILRAVIDVLLVGGAGVIVWALYTAPRTTDQRQAQQIQRRGITYAVLALILALVAAAIIPPARLW